MTNRAKLEHCFRDTLGLPATAAVDHLRYQDDPAWNSLGHMRLVSALETQFSISFTTEEILDMNSYAKAAELLEKHGVDLTA